MKKLLTITFSMLLLLGVATTIAQVNNGEVPFPPKKDTVKDDIPFPPNWRAKTANDSIKVNKYSDDMDDSATTAAIMNGEYKGPARNTNTDTNPVKPDTTENINMPAAPAKPSGTAFVVISKLELKLNVYDRNADGDTVLVAQFPCCLSKNKGNKQKVGDMRTPESPENKPFKITQIQNSAGWTHDFKDGRGKIKAYGHWFLRLLTPGHSGIGIHGSTNNEKSVPGRASEGCIRLRDTDIITFKESYAYVGMPIYIHHEDEAPYSWEIRARERSKNK